MLSQMLSEIPWCSLGFYYGGHALFYTLKPACLSSGGGGDTALRIERLNRRATP